MSTLYRNIHQSLLDRCAKGDSKAQFEIYRLYYKSMYNSSLRILGIPEEAEDVMQESFLAAFDKLATYKSEVSFGSWLKRIVINRSLDQLRKRKISFEEIRSDLPLPSETDEDHWSDLISVEQVKHAIDELPDGYRTILSLILFDGYTHEEVSKMLNISNVTSRTQYLRARQRLKERLKTTIY